MLWNTCEGVCVLMSYVTKRHYHLRGAGLACVVCILWLAAGCRTIPDGCYARYSSGSTLSDESKDPTEEAALLAKAPSYSALLEFSSSVGRVLAYCQSVIKFASLPQDDATDVAVMKVRIWTSRRCLSSSPNAQAHRLLLWVDGAQQGSVAEEHLEDRGYLVFDLSSTELNAFITARSAVVQKHGMELEQAWSDALWSSAPAQFFALSPESEAAKQFYGPGSSSATDLAACAAEADAQGVEYKALREALAQKNHQMGCVSFGELVWFEGEVQVDQHRLQSVATRSRALPAGDTADVRPQDISAGPLGDETKLWQHFAADSTITAENFASSWAEKPYVVEYRTQRYRVWQSQKDHLGGSTEVYALFSTTEAESIEDLTETGYAWEYKPFGGLIRGPLMLWQNQGGVVPDPLIITQGIPRSVVLSVDQKPITILEPSSFEEKILGRSAEPMESPSVGGADGLRNVAIPLVSTNVCGNK